MTPEAFEKELRGSGGYQFAEVLKGLDEQQRKDFLKVVKSVRTSVRRELKAFDTDDWETSYKERQRWDKRNPVVETNILLGLLGCGNASDVQRVPLWELGESRDHVVPILRARKPGWLSNWVNKRMEDEWPDLTWVEVRGLLKDGLIEKPTGNGYADLFIGAMRGYSRRGKEKYVPTSERLRKEPDLLDDEVWRLFEYENHALTTDWEAKYKDGPSNYETFPQALIRLVDSGDLDRKRMLSITLSSMHQEMKQNQLSAYGKLHAALKPTADEQAGHLQDYLDLLVSPVGPVISFAMKMIGQLDKAGALNAELFLDSVAPVFSHKTKGTASQALKITARFFEPDKGLAKKAGEVAVAAMGHPSPDVQAAAVALITANADKLDDATLETFERQIPFLSAKLQSMAREVLGDSTETELAEAVSTDDIRAELSGVSPELLNLVGIDADDPLKMPAPMTAPALSLPGVADAEPLVPVQTRDELLELTAQLIENVDNPGQLEVLLDGIARLGLDKSGDFEKLAAPLVQRIENGVPSSYGLCSGWGNMSVAVADLVMSWLTGKHYDSRGTRYYNESPQQAFGVSRIREITARLQSGIASAQVCLPSYSSGWLDPETFAARVAAIGEKETVGGYDLMLAMMRLGPGDQQAALETLNDSKWVLTKLARYALGGDADPGLLERKNAHLWLAASLNRPVEGELPKAISGKLPKALRELDAHDDAQWRVVTEENQGYKWSRVRLAETSLHIIDRGSPYFESLVDKAKKLADPDWELWPTLGLRMTSKTRWYNVYSYTSPWAVHWQSLQQPSDTESFMAGAMRLLDLRSDENTSRDTPVHAFMFPLFDATREWKDLTHLAVALSALSRSSDTRGYAVDVLIPAIENGRANRQLFANTLSRLLAGGAYKINRFPEAMMPILDVSDLHKWWVGALVDDIVTQLDETPKGAHFLYEVALECLLPLGLSPSVAMKERLAAHKGSSKMARLARELLALDGPSVDDPGEAVINAAVAARLEFAKSLC